jgi:hypothetical protein
VENVVISSFELHGKIRGRKQSKEVGVEEVVVVEEEVEEKKKRRAGKTSHRKHML